MTSPFQSALSMHFWVHLVVAYSHGLNLLPFLLLLIVPGIIFKNSEKWSNLLTFSNLVRSRLKSSIVWRSFFSIFSCSACRLLQRFCQIRRTSSWMCVLHFKLIMRFSLLLYPSTLYSLSWLLDSSYHWLTHFSPFTGENFQESEF